MLTLDNELVPTNGCACTSRGSGRAKWVVRVL